MGRPPSPDSFTEPMQLRHRTDQHERWVKAATKLGKSLTEFARDGVDRYADEVLDD